MIGVQDIEWHLSPLQSASIERIASSRNSNSLSVNFSLHLLITDATDLASCQKLASKLNKLEDLPSACKNYSSVVEAVKRKTTSVTAEDIAFQGMRPGQAIQARRSRAGGVEHQAKLNRRMTSGSGNKYHYIPQKTPAN
jgi:hypothetical protein